MKNLLELEQYESYNKLKYINDNIINNKLKLINDETIELNEHEHKQIAISSLKDIIKREARFINIFIIVNDKGIYQLDNIRMVSKCLLIYDEIEYDDSGKAYSDILEYIQYLILEIIKEYDRNIINKIDKTILKNAVICIVYAMIQLSYGILLTYFTKEDKTSYINNYINNYKNLIIKIDINNINNINVYKLFKIPLINLVDGQQPNIIRISTFKDICLYDKPEICETFIEQYNIIKRNEKDYIKIYTYKFTDLKDSNGKLLFINNIFSSHIHKIYNMDNDKNVEKYVINTLSTKNIYYFLNSFKKYHINNSKSNIVHLGNLKPLNNDTKHIKPNTFYKLTDFNLLSGSTELNTFNKINPKDLYYFIFNTRTFETGDIDYNFNIGINNMNENTKKSMINKISGSIIPNIGNYMNKLIKSLFIIKYTSDNGKINYIKDLHLINLILINLNFLNLGNDYSNVKTNFTKVWHSLINNMYKQFEQKYNENENNGNNYNKEIFKQKFEQKFEMYKSNYTVNYLLLFSISFNNVLLKLINNIYGEQNYESNPSYYNIKHPYSIIIDLDNDIIYKNNFHKLDSKTMKIENTILQSFTFFSLKEVKNKNFGCIFTVYNNKKDLLESKLKYPKVEPLSKPITFINL